MFSYNRALLLVLVLCTMACGDDASAPENNVLTPDSDTNESIDIPAPQDVSDPTEEWDCDDPDAEKKDPGCPCTQNSNCASGWCVDNPQNGSVCTDTCID